MDHNLQDLKSQLALAEKNIKTFSMIDKQTDEDRRILRENEEKRAILSKQLLSLEASQHAFRFRYL